MAKDKYFKIDLSQFNINGIVHVGAGEGEFARCYHGLGVHQVLWIEKKEQLYAPLYNNTKMFGMKQEQHMACLSEVHRPDLGVTNFLSLWRDKSFDPYTYDLLHIACSKNQVKILEGFSFLIENFKEVVFTGSPAASWDPVSDYMESNGFVMSEFVPSHDDSVENEWLFVKRS